MLNKRIIGASLLVFVCLFMFVSSSAQGKSSALVLEEIRFFESGGELPEYSQRNYYTTFPNSTTRFVWTQVDLKNLLYKRKKHVHEVIFEYYDNKGNLIGEAKESLVVKPEWKNFWHCSGLGWEEPNWTDGHYTVHVLIDGKKMGEQGFEIMNDIDFILTGKDVFDEAFKSAEKLLEDLEYLKEPFYLKIVQGKRTLSVKDMDKITIRNDPFMFVFPIRKQSPQALYSVQIAGSKNHAILREVRPDIAYESTACFKIGTGIATARGPYQTFWLKGHHYIIFEPEGVRRAELISSLGNDRYEVSWTVRSFDDVPITKLRGPIFVVATSDKDLDGVIDKTELIRFTLNLRE